ncbi:MAG: nuclear transport factor 2 family protein [Bacteroidetes bacterium]|nr:nuclear transport factor 2 family protein [Bacteroidota bacterium]
MTRPHIFLILAGLAITSGVQAQSQIEAVLDDFHLAASEADYDRYFGHLAEESIFLGTDITERWTKAEFQDYARPHFNAGRGWTYVAKNRYVYVAPDDQTAWFDEILYNEKFGDVRGTGTLILEEDTWKIVQYHLTLPVPNDLIGKLVEMINDQSE